MQSQGQHGVFKVTKCKWCYVQDALRLVNGLIGGA